MLPSITISYFYDILIWLANFPSVGLIKTFHYILVLGRRLPRIPEHPPVHVSELRRPRHVRPLRRSGSLWLQLSRRTLLLLRQGETGTLDFFGLSDFTKG